MANWYVNYGNGSSTGYFAVMPWSAGMAMTVGVFCRPTAPAAGSERIYRCTTAGTGNVAGGTEPTWATTKASTTADNSGVWTEVTGNETYQGPVGGVWTAPHARIANAIAWAAGGDNIFVASNHAETQASALTLTSPSNNPSTQTSMYCVGQTHVPPTSADQTTGASVSTTGASSINIDNWWTEINGIAFNAGSGANAASIIFGSATSGGPILRNCALNLTGTVTSSRIAFGAGNSSGWYELINTTMSFAAAQSINMNAGGIFKWRDTPSALSYGGAVPSILFTGNVKCGVLIEGVDLSAAAGVQLLANAGADGAKWTIKDCKMPASFTAGAWLTAGSPYCGASELTLIRCDSGAGKQRTEKHVPGLGQQTTSNTVVRTGGASDGVTPMSWNINTGACTSNYAGFGFNFESLPISIWNGVTGSDVTVTMHGICGTSSQSALPNNNELWMEVEYLGSASSPLGSRKSSGNASKLVAGAAVSADTSAAWDSQATAWTAGATMSIGDIRKFAGSPGQLYIVSARSSDYHTGSVEPTPVADGTTVVDNHVTWRAMMRFSMSVTLTSPSPAQIGYLTSYIRAGLASRSYYIDPLPTLS